jgi:alpha-glucosidase (family GH31 glycosyl hydrolase)
MHLLTDDFNLLLALCPLWIHHKRHTSVASHTCQVLPGWVYDWTRGFQQQMRARGKKEGDYFLLSRNAWAGTASHGAALWSGDIRSSWSELAAAVTAGQGAAMSGVQLWTTDIGGYGGGDPSSPSFQQLIVRWFQFGEYR